MRIFKIKYSNFSLKKLLKSTIMYSKDIKTNVHKHQVYFNSKKKKYVFHITYRVMSGKSYQVQVGSSHGLSPRTGFRSCHE